MAHETIKQIADLKIYLKTEMDAGFQQTHAMLAQILRSRPGKKNTDKNR